MPPRIQIELPDSLAGLDLEQHLRRFNARATPAADGAIRIVVENASPPVVVLRAVQEWADGWNHLGEIEVSVGRRHYLLAAHGLHWTRGGVAFPLE